jgi:hypothetical protein
LNAAGQEIASDTPFVALDAVPPGGRAPFSVLFSSPPHGVIDFQAYVVRADQAYNFGSRYTQLQVTDVQTRPVGTQYSASGKVSNTGSSNVVEANVVITLYADDGRVTGFRRFALPDDQLAAGGSTNFEVLLSPDPSAPAVANSSIVAQARTR